MYNRVEQWEELPPTMDPADPLNFNWDQAEYGMAFEDVNGDLLWFSHQSSYPMYVWMENEIREMVLVHQFSLIRMPGYDLENRRVA
jgi:hypothetical protein